MCTYMSNNSAMREKMLTMVWSTSGEHHPLDGSTSVVQYCV